MKIYSGTGVASTGNLKVNKGLHSIVIASSKAFTSLAGETITVYVERPLGSNYEIATKIPVIDFVVESTYGGETVQSDANFAFISVCEITDGDGAYMLQEGENIIISLDGLTTTDTWAIYGLEDAIFSMHLKKLDRKTMASEDFTKVFSTLGFGMAVISDVGNTVSDYTLTYSNGTRVKYLPFELQCIERDTDPIAYINAAGAVKQDVGRLVIPLSSPDGGISVDSIEINKPQGAVVNVVLSNVNFAG